MANNGLFLGWNRSHLGRESQGMEVFMGFLGWLGSKVGKDIESFEPVLLAPHGGDLNGFILIRGEGNKLDALVRNAEWQDWLTKGLFTTDHIGVTQAYIGDSLNEFIGRWQTVISKR